MSAVLFVFLVLLVNHWDASGWYIFWGLVALCLCTETVIVKKDKA